MARTCPLALRRWVHPTLTLLESRSTTSPFSGRVSVKTAPGWLSPAGSTSVPWKTSLTISPNTSASFFLSNNLSPLTLDLSNVRQTLVFCVSQPPRDTHETLHLSPWISLTRLEGGEAPVFSLPWGKWEREEKFHPAAAFSKCNLFHSFFDFKISYTGSETSPLQVLV